MDEAKIKLIRMKFKYILLFSLFVSVLQAKSENTNFQNLISIFESEYRALNIPYIQLSYKANLENIDSRTVLKTQKTFFLKYQKSLRAFLNSALSKNEQLTLEVLLYEIDLNLERVDLETKWNTRNYEVKGNRIVDEYLGKQWYIYFLKKWVDKDLNPDSAYAFGLKEIKKVKKRMMNLQSEIETYTSKHPSLDNDYLLSDKDLIIEKYNALNLKVIKNAQRYFPFIDEIPAIQVAQGTNQAMAIAPAYYGNNTFYFNFFQNNYDSRDMGWVFIHEAVPGHHYQHYINQKMSDPTRSQFQYMGYLEGWGAYIEQFGKMLGAYKTPLDTYAQMEWDLIRSVRVALDVGLNYYGWSDEEAFAFWEKHIKNKPDIAQREITRMKRWPAQVITYKYGEQVLNELKGDIHSAEALKNFHQQVLEDGVLPLSILKKNVLRKQDIQSKKEREHQSKLLTIDQTINSLYQVISGAKGEERDWDFLRYLFHPEAKFIFSGNRKDGSFGAKYVTMDDYIKTSGTFMLEKGFYENEIHRVTEQFGNIAHVFSTYECFHNKDDEKPFMRGINSIQLMFTGNRWQVISIYFTQETEEYPIPEKYLEN